MWGDRPDGRSKRPPKGGVQTAAGPVGPTLKDMDRRQFIKISGLTGSSATLASCGNPEYHLIRFIPEDRIVPGTAVWRPSICPLCPRSEEHTSELQSLAYLVCRLLLEKKK